MNWKTAFFITLAALIAVLFWALKLQPGNNDNSSQIKSGICNDTGYETPPLDTAEALERINDYLTYLNMVEVVDKQKLEKGIVTNNVNLDSIPEYNRKVKNFHLEAPCELRDIINNASTEDSIFVVLGLEPVPDTLNLRMIDILFKVKTDQPVGKHTTAGGYTFFDFTSPCPPICFY